jgi:2-polyprenyl-6-methoxyphenol hydroxylase-like FAD-dependent oxidoreductase
VIVGAGIGGLAAGVMLRRTGWDVRIFERTAAPREIGFGLGLAPNAARALRELGVASQVFADGMTMGSGGKAELRRTDGRLLRRVIVPRERLGAMDPMGVVLRPVLHNALLDAIGRDTIHANHDAIGFETSTEGVVVRFENGERTAGDILIGADGIGSVIRRQLHPDEPPPRPSGYHALRGVSLAVDLLDGVQFIALFGPGVEIGIVQASSTMVYWYVSLLTKDVGHGANSPQDVLQHVTHTFDPQFRAIAARASTLRLDELFVRSPLTTWGAAPVTLLGDAAHPMLPHAGQGAAQALEDAVQLGRALGAPGDPAAGLRAYERARIPRANSFVRLGQRIARVTTTHNPVLGAVRNTVIRLTPTAALLKSFLEAVPEKA